MYFVNNIIVSNTFYFIRLLHNFNEQKFKIFRRLCDFGCEKYTVLN